jgi:hypothetical protein
VSFLQKYNILMAQMSLKDASDSEYAKGISAFCILNYTQMLMQEV